ncbi:MAG: HAD-IC family P-type ATPase [Deltaproteobacteria bacterium]|nr:HAD-IC family P-type ATPase [Deltaproteobacteria bacterium]
MTLSSLLSKELIILDFMAKDHTEALKNMVCLLGKACEDEASIKALKDHESIDGVLLGTGSAIFHTFSDTVEDIKVVLSLSQRGIPHPIKRREKIHILFLLVSPITESGTHFQLLSLLEGFLLNKTFRNAILTAKTKEAVTGIVKREEGLGRDAYIPLTREEIFAELNTRETGLTEKEAIHRLATVGPNILKKVARKHILYDFLQNMTNLFAILLWLGGILSFVAGMPELGWAIFLVIIINASFSFWQEYKAEQAVEALQKLLPQKVKTIREGKEKEIQGGELVPGDIVLLQEGDNIPADGRLIHTDDMRVDNSPLTGESRPVYKVAESLENGKNFIWAEMPNLIFAGTNVLSGAGKLVVTATGMDTEIGKVAYLTQSIKTEMSPLQKEMARVTKVVTWIAVTLGLVFFLLGFKIAGLTLSESFIFAIGIIVANVPEGLLPTLSLSLAMGVQRMARKNAIVKKLSAVETLGSINCICTDKTGTLTTNEMRVTRLWVNEKDIEITGKGYEPTGNFIWNGKTFSADDLNKEGIDELLKAASLCNNANLIAPLQKGASWGWSISGDPTEGALLVAAKKAGLKLEELKKENPRVGHLAFERIRKRMTTIHKQGTGIEGQGSGKIMIAYVKGAPKEMLDLCTMMYRDGMAVSLTDKDKEIILKQNDFMASQGLRVLAVAYREIQSGIRSQESGDKTKYTEDDVEKDLTFIGLIAMFDPPRPEVKRAIEECHTAGIRIIVMTGDYGLTAQAIAKEVGVGGSNPKVVTGLELSRLSRRELRELLKPTNRSHAERGNEKKVEHGSKTANEIIFARVAPKDKLRVVSTLQELGEIVAVTGDGVNDAPALKKADIGIAMGLRGSDVAKEAAEIVLADDNFATIVEAIKEGRAVYANIKKFVTYIFASNIPEIVPFIAFVLFKIPLPLTVMQILAVDLGTDVVPALGLGVEPPEKGIMNQPPRPRTKRLLDFSLLSRAYLFLGPIEAALCMGGFFFVYWLSGWQWGESMPSSGIIYTTATTISLAGIVTSQIGNVFACRTEKESIFSVGFFNNRLVLFGVAVEIALILFLTYMPFMQKTFGLSPLGLKEWTFLLLFPVTVLSMEEIRKWTAKVRNGNNEKK